MQGVLTKKNKIIEIHKIWSFRFCNLLVLPWSLRVEKSLLSVETENTSEELKKLLKNKNIVRGADQILGKRLEERRKRDRNFFEQFES